MSDNHSKEQFKKYSLIAPEHFNKEIENIEDEDYISLLKLFFKVLTTVELSTYELNFLIPTSSIYYEHFFKFQKIKYLNPLKEPLKRVYSRNEFSKFKNFISTELEKRKSNYIDEGVGNQYLITLKEFENAFLFKWFKEFEIGHKLCYGYNDNNDTFFIKVDNKSLLEYGYGNNSILYILITLAFENESFNLNDNYEAKLTFPPTYIIEEPETGLHPAFQAKMAEMIVDIHKTFGVNLIVETHSEYFIRKLQYLTATNELNPGDAVIYYFNKPKSIPEGEEQIKKITIEKNGSLTDSFGPGFIDEGTNLKFDLIRLNKTHTN